MEAQVTHGPRFLLVGGNVAEARENLRAVGAKTGTEVYAEALMRLCPDAQIVTVHPSDPDGGLPTGVAFSDFDGIVTGGSALHVYEACDPVRRQIEFCREALQSGVPFFGSCWGAQVAAVALGGVVAPCAKGMEIGIGRSIRLTDAGAGHPLFHEKTRSFDAMVIHSDEITALPAGAVLLAYNDHSPIQAYAYERDGVSLWAVQYHPEFDFRQMARLYRRVAPLLVENGRFDDEAAVEAISHHYENAAEGDVRALRAIAAEVDVSKPDIRLREVANWLRHKVEFSEKNQG